MENLVIEETVTSPRIDLNGQTHIHSFKGESYSDNMYLFYDPVIAWLESYLQALDCKATFNFELHYFNSSSSKVLMDIFYMLDDAAQNGKTIVVNWMYDKDNEALEEYGEEFAEDVEDVEFNLVSK